MLFVNYLFLVLGAGLYLFVVRTYAGVRRNDVRVGRYG